MTLTPAVRRAIELRCRDVDLHLAHTGEVAAALAGRLEEIRAQRAALIDERVELGRGAPRRRRPLLMTAVECADCGLVPFDLPDGVDAEFVFERGEDGVMRCRGCQELHDHRRADWDALR